jgi:hypothetical protein
MTSRISFGLPKVPAKRNYTVVGATANVQALCRDKQYIGLHCTGMRAVPQYEARTAEENAAWRTLQQNLGA